MGIVNLLGGNVATIGSQFHYVPLTAPGTHPAAPAATDAAVSLPRSDYRQVDSLRGAAASAAFSMAMGL